MINIVNQKLDPIVKKAHETHKAIVGLKNNILEPLLEAKKSLSERNQAWCRAEEEKIEKAQREDEEAARKRDEKREKIQAYHESVGHKTVELEPTVIKDVIPFIPTTKERVSYDVKVINKALVPEEHKLIDLVGIRKLMFAAPRDQENRPIFEMPGIEVYAKKIPVYA
jgi:ribosomal protein L9